MADNDYSSEITGVYVGRQRVVRRTYTEDIAEQIVTAYLTVKATKITSDPEIFSLAVTVTPTYDGVITDDGQSSHTVDLTLVLTAAHTTLLTGNGPYWYEVLLVSANNTYTAERGYLRPRAPLSASH